MICKLVWLAVFLTLDKSMKIT